MAISFTVELQDGLMDGLIEVFGAGEGLVSELMSLQVAPELFDFAPRPQQQVICPP
jgi:hypothetical protein